MEGLWSGQGGGNMDIVMVARDVGRIGGRKGVGIG